MLGSDIELAMSRASSVKWVASGLSVRFVTYQHARVGRRTNAAGRLPWGCKHTAYLVVRDRKLAPAKLVAIHALCEIHLTRIGDTGQFRPIIGAGGHPPRQG